MALWIMRHGEALGGDIDELRELSEEGQRQCVQAGDWLAGRIRQPGGLRIISSPYQRARHTAAIVADSCAAEVAESDLLRPDGDVELILEWLTATEEAEDRLIVSHMPLVGRLVGRLLEGDVHASHPFTTAEVIGLDAEVWAAGCAMHYAGFYPTAQG